MTVSENVIKTDQIKVNITMPIDQAEQVIWQGAGPREPMGRLLQEGVLTEKDLAWAMEHAYNRSVREASRTLLAYWLGSPETIQTTLRYGPKVIGNSDYLETEEWNSGLNALWYAFIGIIVVTFLGMWWISRLFDVMSGSKSWIVTIIVAILVLIAVAIVLSPLLWYLRRKWREGYERMPTFRAGRKAEERLLETVRANLDNRWTIFRNLVLPNRWADIDLVLVGPPGIYVVEVKAYKSQVRNCQFPEFLTYA